MSEVAKPFPSSRLKIARARQHLAELAALIAAFQKDGGPTWEPVSDDALPANMTAAHKINFRPYPETLNPIVGDVIHNLRASLDLMASEMVRSAGRDDLHVHFPIAASEQKLKGLIKSQRFDDAGQDAVDLLLRFKPYAGGCRELSELHALDLMDKHRALVTPRCSIVGPVIQLWEDDGTINPRIISDPSAPLQTRFFFPPESGFGDQEIVPGLEDIAALVESIVDAFSKLVSKSEEL